ncbi:MAG TPA: transposase zinc-binding domain-containing protein, partial [Roseiarcus sp.]|nr:transposase zinc-binding domain-containing protein [Roseiarcus sp.]
AHGAAWRKANAGHVSLAQLKVMSAIETCRTSALGGHVERCEDCAHTRVAYNSCRNRHCPKCQAAAARQWLAEREAELLPVPYYHVVFTLPAAIGAIAFQNKAAVYDLLTLDAAEFIRRFLLHVLPSGFNCIRHYGFFASRLRRRGRDRRAAAASLSLILREPDGRRRRRPCAVARVAPRFQPHPSQRSQRPDRPRQDCRP